MPHPEAHGGLARLQFQWQARAWGEALAGASVPLRTECAAGLNHFEVLEALGESDGLLATAVLAQIRR